MCHVGVKYYYPINGGLGVSKVAQDVSDGPAGIAQSNTIIFANTQYDVD
jgi:hypothetical protein